MTCAQPSAALALMLAFVFAAKDASAGGVSYIVGGGHAAMIGARKIAAQGVAPIESVATVSASDTAPRARGVVLSGARLATANTWHTPRFATLTAMPAALAYPVAPRTRACLDCNFDAVAPIIRAASDRAQVDPALVAAVIEVESGFRRDALSPAGAQGLMQLMPATASRFGVSNANDPVQNIAAGTLYLGQLIRQFSGNVRYALAAYNAGEANVRTYGGIPPFAETRAYVPHVLARYAAFRGVNGGAAIGGSMMPVRAVARPDDGAVHMALTEYR